MKVNVTNQIKTVSASLKVLIVIETVNVLCTVTTSLRVAIARIPASLTSVTVPKTIKSATKCFVEIVERQALKSQFAKI